MMVTRPRSVPSQRGPSFYVASVLWLLVLVLTALWLLAILAVDWRHARADFRPVPSDIVGPLPVMAFATVGALIAWRQPRNRMGWLLLATALAATFLTLPKLYAGIGIDIKPGSLPAPLSVYAISQVLRIVPSELLLVFLPLLFPNGQLPSRRWRVVLWLAGLMALMTIAAALDPTASASGLRNPFGVSVLRGISNVLTIPFMIVLPLTSALAIASLVVRYRRGGDRERQQLKWLVVAVILVLAASTLQFSTPQLRNGFLLPLMATALPIAVGIAVLRYRLYDIDLIINKAVVYGGLGGVITAVYLLLVVGIGAMIGSNQRFLLSLVATAVIALAFQPLRDRAQRLANRLVYGKRATPYEALSQFSEHLSETYSNEDILDRMARILAQGTGAERAEVWVRAGQRLVLASSSPPATEALRPVLMQNGALPEMQRDTVVPVSHAGELLGALAVDKKRGDPMNSVEQKLVNDLAGQAGLVLKNVGLNRELLARLEDLRASRQRLVTAQDEERRRLERDLHDGAQQHLVALKVKLGLAQAVAEPESKVSALIAQLKQDADDALDTLRELARGIYPPLLASDGLEAALRAQIRRVPVPVDLQLDDVARQPREVEGAIYFCCLEALQNVAKYAEATRVCLRLRTEDATLDFRVEDDGKGFDPVRVPYGSGLQNMRDRLEALGGSLEVSSAPGRGTTIQGSVPVGLATP
jgi:signal transduction histidine kinase